VQFPHLLSKTQDIVFLFDINGYISRFRQNGKCPSTGSPEKGGVMLFSDG
jgi:hypothetical protein